MESSLGAERNDRELAPLMGSQSHPTVHISQQAMGSPEGTLRSDPAPLQSQV